MADKILLSIIIVNYHSFPYLLSCLNYLTKGKVLPKNSEIIVVLNSATLSESKILSSKYKSVRVISSHKNLGFAKANNVAAAKSRGEFILFLNPDTFVSPGAIPEVLRIMQKKRDIGAATCKVTLPNGQLDDACHRGFPTPWNAFCYFSGLAHLFPKTQLFNNYHLGYQSMDTIHEIDSCVGAFMMVRRNAGDDLSWFDTDYFWYGEDIDFCYRLKKNGWKIIFIPTVSIVHFKGISSGIKNHSKLLSQATLETRRRSTKARFEVMRTFYQKHYYNHYNVVVRELVMHGITLFENLKLLSMK